MENLLIKLSNFFLQLEVTSTQKAQPRPGVHPTVKQITMRIRSRKLDFQNYAGPWCMTVVKRGEVIRSESGCDPNMQ